MKFYLETLGCPKNLTDSQGMTRELQRLGHRAVKDPRRAQVLIVNTCGFIAAARQESLQALQALAQNKGAGQLLIAAGCLSQYWGERLAGRIPGVDALLGTRRWSEIGALLAEMEKVAGRPHLPFDRLGDPLQGPVALGAQFARQGASAYVKVADGCSAPCSFCAIPAIKGPAVSRPPHAIASDARELVEQGVKEIVLIAQDTTAYGLDRGERDALPGLLRAILEAAPELRWLRLMYAYPAHVSARLVRLMAAEPRICHYLDLPLQHAHPAMLRRMRRPASIDATYRLIARLRRAMPDLALRTTFIVGHPGETKAEYQALLEFVEEIRFDHVGVFKYSAEEGTTAAGLPGMVPEDVKLERYERLMQIQQGISRRANEAQVGRTFEVLVEGQGDGLCIGRCYRDAPEIDGLVLFSGQAQTGNMLPVTISGAIEYDLIGTVSHEA